MPNVGGMEFSKKELAEFARLEFVWVTMKDGKVCDTCVGRGNSGPKPFKTWESIGLPKAGTTICQTKCRCILVPNNVMGAFPSIRGNLVDLRDDQNLVISKKVEYGRYNYLDRLIEKYKSANRNLPKQYYDIYDLEERITFLEGITNG